MRYRKRDEERREDNPRGRKKNGEERMQGEGREREKGKKSNLLASNFYNKLRSFRNYLKQLCFQF
jgi:hypothetical protein